MPSKIFDGRINENKDAFFQNNDAQSVMKKIVCFVLVFQKKDRSGSVGTLIFKIKKIFDGRINENKDAFFQNNDVQKVLMPSPSVSSKFGSSMLKFFKHAQFIMYTQNYFGILKR